MIDPVCFDVTSLSAWLRDNVLTEKGRRLVDSYPKDSRPMPVSVRAALDDALSDHLRWQEERDEADRQQAEILGRVEPCDEVA